MLLGPVYFDLNRDPQQAEVKSIKLHQKLAAEDILQVLQIRLIISC